MTTLPPPSWQRDPLGRYEYRFWDGTQWSDHVATGGIQGIDPLPHAPVSGSDPKTQQFSAHHPSKRQIAKQGRNQFENLAIKAAHGDTDAVQALPAAATQAREYYRNDKKYLDEAWAVMTVALRDVLTDDVLTEQGDTHIAKLASALGIHPADLAHRNFALWEEVMVARINDGRPLPDDRGPLITQPGETAYGPTFAVALMKEVVDRQLRGGSSGVSADRKGRLLPRRSGTCPQCCCRHAPGGPRFWTPRSHRPPRGFHGNQEDIGISTGPARRTSTVRRRTSP
jgi:Protein of unknown function (DUF2510)